MKPDLNQPTSPGALLEAAARALDAAGVDCAQLEAEILLAAAMGMSRERVVAGAVELTPRAVERYGQFIARRAAREPVAYILGRKEFFSLEFAVTPDVLIPRPETEVLVGAALEIVSPKPESRILDLATGCGAIAVAVAANAPRARLVATDKSQGALEVAARNACRHAVRDRIEFRQGDLWAAVADGETFDLVVSNPPYVADAEMHSLAPEIARFEPRIALAAGADGLDFYPRIVARVRDHLSHRGDLLLEVGAGQGVAVAALCREAGAARIEVLEDLAGLGRVVRAGFGPWQGAEKAI